MKIRLKLLTTCMFLIPVLTVAAENTSTGKEKDLPEPVKALQQMGFEIRGDAEPVKGMTGYVTEYQGQGATVYLTPDKQHVIVGNLVDSRGENLSEPQIEKLVYKPQSDAMWERLDKSDWIGVGKGERIVYAFFDPYCPYCTSFWNSAKPWIERGEVQLRVFLVGIIRKDSQTRAAALMQAADPVKALTEYEDSHWDIHPADPQLITAEIRKKLMANEKLMQVLGVNATPAMYYQDKSGNLQQQLGAPNNEIMEQIMGSQLKKE